MVSPELPQEESLPFSAEGSLSSHVGATGVDGKPRPEDGVILAFAWEPESSRDSRKTYCSESEME